ncbi:MAG: hypothetical protein AAFV95_04710 [Bacteroidota bacterium]
MTPPNPFDQQIKKQLDGREMNPPSANWDRISKRLPLHPLLRRLALTLAPIAALMAFAVMMNWWYLLPIKTPKPMAQQAYLSSTDFVLDVSAQEEEERIKQLLQESREPSSLPLPTAEQMHEPQEKRRGESPSNSPQLTQNQPKAASTSDLRIHIPLKLMSDDELQQLLQREGP